MLGDERVELVDADAVLTRTGSTHGDRAPADLLRMYLSFFPYDLRIRIQQHYEMEVSISDMPDDRCCQSGCLTDCVLETRADVEATGLTAPIVRREIGTQASVANA